MNNQTSIQTLLSQSEAIALQAHQLESARSTDEAVLHYDVALAMLQVLARLPGESYRLLQQLAFVSERLGLLHLLRLDGYKAALHLESAVAGYDRVLGAGSVKSMKLKVRLAEALVRCGSAVPAQAAAQSAVAMLEGVEAYRGASKAYAYYWLYRSELLRGEHEAAAAAASKMGAYLAANPELLNSGSFALLLREVAGQVS